MTVAAFINIKGETPIKILGIDQGREEFVADLIGAFNADAEAFAFSGTNTAVVPLAYIGYVHVVDEREKINDGAEG